MLVLNALDITGVDKEHFYTNRRFPIVVQTRALIAKALREYHYTMKHIAQVLKITPEMAINYVNINHNEYIEKNPEYLNMYSKLINAIEQIHSNDAGIEQRLSDVEVEMNRMKQRVDHLSKLVVE
jgi:predicted transcriptional regulator